MLETAAKGTVDMVELGVIAEGLDCVDPLDSASSHVSSFDVLCFVWVVFISCRFWGLRCMCGSGWEEFSEARTERALGIWSG